MRLLDSARIGLSALFPHGVLRHQLDHLRPGKIMPHGIPRKTLAVSIALSAALVTSSPAHAAITYSPLPKLPALSASTLSPTLPVAAYSGPPPFTSPPELLRSPFVCTCLGPPPPVRTGRRG